eukprot:COSAG05_NODE_3606_length_1963_cov_68.999515_3_plen_35_part_01
MGEWTSLLFSLAPTSAQAIEGGAFCLVHLTSVHRP